MFFNLSSFRGIFSIFIACICVNFCKEFVRADATGQGSSTSREHPTAQKGGTNGKKAQASAPNSQTADDSPTPADEGIFDYREGSLDFGSNIFKNSRNIYSVPPSLLSTPPPLNSRTNGSSRNRNSIPPHQHDIFPQPDATIPTRILTSKRPNFGTSSTLSHNIVAIHGRVSAEKEMAINIAERNNNARTKPPMSRSTVEADKASEVSAELPDSNSSASNEEEMVFLHPNKMKKAGAVGVCSWQVLNLFLLIWSICSTIAWLIFVGGKLGRILMSRTKQRRKKTSSSSGQVLNIEAPRPSGFWSYLPSQNRLTSSFRTLEPLSTLWPLAFPSSSNKLRVKNGVVRPQNNIGADRVAFQQTATTTMANGGSNIRCVGASDRASNSSSVTPPVEIDRRNVTERVKIPPPPPPTTNSFGASASKPFVFFS